MAHDHKISLQIAIIVAKQIPWWHRKNIPSSSKGESGLAYRLYDEDYRLQNEKGMHAEVKKLFHRQEKTYWEETFKALKGNFRCKYLSVYGL